MPGHGISPSAARADCVKRLGGTRMPSDGRYLEYENTLFPRAETWDALLAATGAPGIHFQDYPELNQDWNLPEWSHLSQADAERFTAALYGVITRDFWKTPSDAAPAH